MVKVSATTQTILGTASKWDKDHGSLLCVQKLKLSPHPSTVAPSLVPSIPSKVQTKPPTRSTRLGRKSQPQELSPQMTISTAEKNIEPMPGGNKVKEGASAVQKPNVSHFPRTPALLVVPNIPYKVHPKPHGRSTAVGRESQPPSLLPPRTICDAEKNANKISGAREVKAGTATAMANNVSAATNDSNLYSIEGAIDG
jgi:hypothetical protein